jgi:hypothetical protein
LRLEFLHTRLNLLECGHNASLGVGNGRTMP